MAHAQSKLILKFDVCVTNNCTQIRFTDETGFYSTVNTGGWGTPNPALSSITSATLDITTPDSDTYTIDLFATTLFPTDDYGLSYDIPLSEIGSPDSIIDGKWSFIYTVSDGVDEYSTTIYKYFYCNKECCVTQMLANLDLSCDCCKDSDSYKKYELAWLQLQALKKAAACGDETNFTAISKIIDKLCKNNDCKTCK